MSPNSRYIAGASGQLIKIWDLFFEQTPQSFLGHTDEIKHISWSETPQLSTFSWKNGIFRWKFLGSPSQFLPEECEMPSEAESPVEEPGAMQVSLEEEIEEYLNEAQEMSVQVATYKKSSLQHFYGYSQSKHNIVLCQDKGWYLYSIGCVLLKVLLNEDNQQTAMHGHTNTINLLTVSPNTE